MNKLRISLTERDGEVKGKVECEGDGVFRLEALALIVETFAKDSNVSASELLNDLKGIL